MRCAKHDTGMYNVDGIAHCMECDREFAQSAFWWLLFGLCVVLVGSVVFAVK